MRRRGGHRAPAALRLLAERRVRARGGAALQGHRRHDRAPKASPTSVALRTDALRTDALRTVAPRTDAPRTDAGATDAGAVPPPLITSGPPPRRSLFSRPDLASLVDAPEPGSLVDAPEPASLPASVDAPAQDEAPDPAAEDPAAEDPAAEDPAAEAAAAEAAFFGTALHEAPEPTAAGDTAAGDTAAGDTAAGDTAGDAEGGAEGGAEGDVPPGGSPSAGAFEERQVEPMAVSSAGDEPVGARRYTLFMVPAGGQGPLRQVELSLSQVRVAVTAASLLVLLAVVGTVALVVAVPASRSRTALLEENIALRAQMQDVERKLGEVDRELRRLRLYNSQLEELPLDGIPGFGPLSRAEAGRLVWAGRLDPDDLDGAMVEWEMGMPMEEPPGEEVAPQDLTESEVRALELARRADRLLEGVRLVEPQAGELVETAQDWRWRQDARPSFVPVPDGRFTSSFGWRRAPFSQRWKFHTGIDLAAPRGTPVYAAGAGVVARSEWQSGYGRFIVIDHGEGVVSRYAHNSRVFVRRGDRIERGEQIATVGTTGRTTGPHLHFEVYIDDTPVDPEDFLELD